MFFAIAGLNHHLIAAGEHAFINNPALTIST
jgi:hypothetical protein